VTGGPDRLPDWRELAEAIPAITGPMRGYLEQIACVLRPGSVRNADQALRSFAGFLAQTAPEVTGLAQVTRRHIESYKPWLAVLHAQHKPAEPPATIAHRKGKLRKLFVRINEWG